MGSTEGQKKQQPPPENLLPAQVTDSTLKSLLDPKKDSKSFSHNRLLVIQRASTQQIISYLRSPSHTSDCTEIVTDRHIHMYLAESGGRRSPHSIHLFLEGEFPGRTMLKADSLNLSRQQNRVIKRFPVNSKIAIEPNQIDRNGSKNLEFISLFPRQTQSITRFQCDLNPRHLELRHITRI